MVYAKLRDIEVDETMVYVSITFLRSELAALSRVHVNNAYS